MDSLAPTYMNCVLKVDKHSSGWQSSLVRVLRKIQDVSYTIDADKGLAYLSGNVHPHKILEVVERVAKHVKIMKIGYGQDQIGRSAEELLQSDDGLGLGTFPFENYNQFQRIFPYFVYNQYPRAYPYDGYNQYAGIYRHPYDFQQEYWSNHHQPYYHHQYYNQYYEPYYHYLPQAPTPIQFNDNELDYYRNYAGCSVM